MGHSAEDRAFRAADAWHKSVDLYWRAVRVSAPCVRRSASTDYGSTGFSRPGGGGGARGGGLAAAGSGMRDRLELLRTLREARWPLTATPGTALLLQALLPAATAVTMAVLVGTLEQHGGTAGLFGRYRRAAPWR